MLWLSIGLILSCSGIILSNSSKKCVYSNNTCSIFYQTCLDPYTSNVGIDEDETRGVVQISSSDKKYKGNQGGGGCVEASKEEKKLIIMMKQNDQKLTFQIKIFLIK